MPSDQGRTTKGQIYYFRFTSLLSSLKISGAFCSVSSLSIFTPSPPFPDYPRLRKSPHRSVISLVQFFLKAVLAKLGLV